jgi:outer membrane lipoprotein-sorting protein
MSARFFSPLVVVCATVCAGPLALAQPAPAAPAAAAAQPTATELLDAVDKNMTFDARRARMVMTVEGRRTRTFEMIAFSRGEEDSAIEYLSPARETGTRMLKLGDDLWLYLPSVERVQKISGHMLRQGMMGSDLSYEDLMASRELRKAYDAKVTGAETVAGRACWVLELTAKDKSVTYPKRKSCIDKQVFIPLKQELFALSGMLLKTWTMSDVKDFGGRQFPTKMVIEDHIKKESVTRLEFKEMEFGVKHPAEVFSLRWLERR